MEQHLKKQRLVQGRLDYDTHQLLDCTWIDNQGGSGTYPTFQKKASIEEVGGVTIEEIP